MSPDFQAILSFIILLCAGACFSTAVRTNGSKSTAVLILAGPFMVIGMIMVPTIKPILLFKIVLALLLWLVLSVMLKRSEYT